jgi:hypothetical protein
LVFFCACPGKSGVTLAEFKQPNWDVRYGPQADIRGYSTHHPGLAMDAAGEGINLQRAHLMSSTTGVGTNLGNTPAIRGWVLAPFDPFGASVAPFEFRGRPF